MASDSVVSKSKECSKGDQMTRAQKNRRRMAGGQRARWGWAGLGQGQGEAGGTGCIFTSLQTRAKGADFVVG